MSPQPVKVSVVRAMVGEADAEARRLEREIAEANEEMALDDRVKQMSGKEREELECEIKVR